MGGTRGPRPRRLPERTCVGCRTVRPKRELIRVVRTPQGAIELDPSGKRSGRGAYLCPSLACLEQARKGRQLERALERPVDESVYEALRREMERLLQASAESPASRSRER